MIVHTFGPLALIYLVSLVTPLYHVRYAFTYAPPFSLLLAAGIVALVRWHRWTRPLAVLALVALLVTSGFSLRNLWTARVRKMAHGKPLLQSPVAAWRQR